MLTFDTIVAPITALGGAVGVIRLSGPDSVAYTRRIFSGLPSDLVSHRAHYGVFANGDDGLVTVFLEGKSYTGEESTELSVHGSPASVRLLIESLERVGARRARPGEFSERAFLNGRLDLTQAEFVRDTVEAKSDRQLKNANEGRQGGLRREVEATEDLILRTLASIEAHVDFSEELGDLDKHPLRENLAIASESVKNLIIRAQYGRILRQGVRIAIIGPPNSGKSSLLNALLGSDRAIVTSVPGTTRDYVEESCELGGLPCVLIDTAGLRESEDLVESLGIQRSRSIAGGADLIWYVYDSSLGLTGTDRETLAGLSVPCWILANKCDLAPPSEGLPVSALNRLGFEQLEQQVAMLVPNFDGPLPNERHLTSLNLIQESIEQADTALKHDIPADLAVTHLRSALYDLGVITGETASPDLLDRIFSDFCIGK